MKKLLVLAVAVVLVTLPFAGCGPSVSDVTKDYNFEIKVTGTAGEFSGNYLVMKGDFTTNSQSVDGNTPATYTVQGNTVSVTFQKQGEDGTLTVEIFRDGVSVNSSTTSASYGVASATG
ncbi:MAG: hypothetical protein P3T54_00025 [Dehalogenimonas sp.]|nr:hypothetical protein [Dehalogenimonas sp.]